MTAIGRMSPIMCAESCAPGESVVWKTPWPAQLRSVIGTDRSFIIEDISVMPDGTIRAIARNVSMLAQKPLIALLAERTA